MTETRLIRLAEVMRKIGYRRSSIYAKEAAGSFPKRVQLGGKAVAWIEAEVDGWIARRVAESRSRNLNMTSTVQIVEASKQKVTNLLNDRCAKKSDQIAL
jgi:prophage regulatory protein